MSRLRSLYLPFAQGENDAVAREVLPDGSFASLTNARFNKSGQLALRRGWRPVTMTDTAGAAVTARDLYSMNGSLVALTKTASTGLPGLATYSNQNTARPWVSAPGQITPVVDHYARGGLPASDVAVLYASAALTSDAVYGATAAQTASTTQLRVFRVATDDTVFFLGRSSGDPGRWVSLGATFGWVSATGAAITLEILDPSAAAPTLAAPVSLVATATTVFDVVTAVPATSGGTPGGVYLTYVSGGAVSFAKFSLAGVQSGSTKTVSASGASSAVIASDDTRVHVAYRDSAAKTIDLLTFNATSPYATTAGPTAFLTAAVKNRWFVLGVDDTGTATMAAQEDDVSLAGPTCFVRRRSASHAVSLSASRGRTLVTGGVVHVPGGSSAAASAFSAGRDSASLLLSANTAAQPWLALHGLGTIATTGVTIFSAARPFEPAQAPDGTCLVLARTGFAGFQLLVRVVQLSTNTRRQGVLAAGELYVSGGVLTKWSGVVPSEQAFLAPVLDTLTPSNGAGALTPSSTYAYRAFLEWTDAQGRVHQGEVSTEHDVTLGGADDTVAVLLQLPPALARTSDLVVGPSLKLFRTEAGPGELYYLTSTTEDVSRTVDALTVTDLTSDAALIDNERLYTEGDTGATSGRLDNVLARPCRYVAATRDRLVTAARTPEYQFSQLVLAGEPVQFADPGVSGPAALVYLDQVDEDLTAVATMDDSVVLATKQRLYVTSGDGPNYAGVGEFQSAARLPANVGVYDWRSLVESAEGLWFLGDVDKLYQLSRGQSSPEWVGKTVQDRLASGVVGGGVAVDDHVVTWATPSASPAAVVFDLFLKQWSQDGLPFTPTSLVAHQGQLWAVASDGVVWQHHATAYGDGASGATAVALQGETGDVQVFGLGGWGRLATIELEGVYETDAALKLEVSYDQGLSWTDLGTHAVSGLTAGETFQRSYDPSRQRGGKFRLRLTMTPSSTTAEGCRLTGLTLYHTTRPGPTRLPSAKRK